MNQDTFCHSVRVFSVLGYVVSVDPHMAVFPPNLIDEVARSRVWEHTLRKQKVCCQVTLILCSRYLTFRNITPCFIGIQDGPAPLALQGQVVEVSLI